MLISPISAQFSWSGLLKATLTPDLINFWLKKLNPIWSFDQAVAQIVDRQETAKGSVTFVLKLNRHAKIPKAGQHLAVRAQVNGVWVERSYSPSMLQNRPRHLIITVKQVASGKLSQWFMQQAKVGDVLQLGQPFGEFAWPQAQHSVVLLAAGSGITPMISLLRDWSQKPDLRPVQLRYWVSYREQACFVEELLFLQQSKPNFSFQLYLTQEQPLHTHERQGRLSAEQFLEYAEPEQSHVLVCGSADFVHTAQASLPRVNQWQVEAFSPPVRPIEASNQQVTITLQRQQKRLTIPVGQSILVALEAAGMSHPSGCRMGLCNTCACPKTSGTTEHLISREQRHEVDSALRVCISTAKTDLILDL